MFYLYRGIILPNVNDKYVNMYCIAIEKSRKEILDCISSDLKSTKNEKSDRYEWKDETLMEYKRLGDSDYLRIYKIINDDSDSQFITFSFLDPSIDTFESMKPILMIDDMFVYYIDDTRFQFDPSNKTLNTRHKIYKIPVCYEHVPLYEHKKLRKAESLEYYDIGKRTGKEAYSIDIKKLSALNEKELALMKDYQEDLLKRIDDCLNPLLKAKYEISNILNVVNRRIENINVDERWYEYL